jgi:hypothetical protein
VGKPNCSLFDVGGGILYVGWTAARSALFVLLGLTFSDCLFKVPIVCSGFHWDKPVET